MARGASKGINRFDAFQKERRSLVIDSLKEALLTAKKSRLKFDSLTSVSNYIASTITNRGLVSVSSATLRKNPHYREQLENFISEINHPSSVSQGVERVRSELEISQLKDKIKSLESFISKNLAHKPTLNKTYADSDATLSMLKLCQLIDRLLAASEETLALEGSQIIRPYAISKAMRLVADESLVSIYVEHRAYAARLKD